MLSEKDFKELAGEAGGVGSGEGSLANLDAKIDQSIQKREMGKVKDAFYHQMKTHYMVRKSKEFITLKCGDTCFNKRGDNYLDEDMSRLEKTCMLNCYHKTFRYLIHANTVYTYFTADQEVLQEYMGNGPDKLEEAKT